MPPMLQDRSQLATRSGRDDCRSAAKTGEKQGSSSSSVMEMTDASMAGCSTRLFLPPPPPPPPPPLPPPPPPQVDKEPIVRQPIDRVKVHCSLNTVQKHNGNKKKSMVELPDPNHASSCTCWQCDRWQHMPSKKFLELLIHEFNFPEEKTLKVYDLRRRGVLDVGCSGVELIEGLKGIPPIEGAVHLMLGINGEPPEFEPIKGQIKTEPKKQAIIEMTENMSLVSALAEKFDNSLEACRDNHTHGEARTLSLSINIDTKTVQLLDNGKGFNSQNPYAAAQIGSSNGHNSGPEIESFGDFFSAIIGRFGVGSKHSFFRIGEKETTRSKQRGVNTVMTVINSTKGDSWDSKYEMNHVEKLTSKSILDDEKLFSLDSGTEVTIEGFSPQLFGEDREVRKNAFNALCQNFKDMYYFYISAKSSEGVTGKEEFDEGWLYAKKKMLDLLKEPKRQRGRPHMDHMRSKLQTALESSASVTASQLKRTPIGFDVEISMREGGKTSSKILSSEPSFLDHVFGKNAQACFPLHFEESTADGYLAIAMGAIFYYPKEEEETVPALDPALHQNIQVKKFLTYWQGRLLPDQVMTSLITPPGPNKVDLKIPDRCYGRCFGVLWVNDKFKPDTNKQRLVQSDSPHNDVLLSLTKFLNGETNDLRKAFSSWLLDCHLQFDHEYEFVGTGKYYNSQTKYTTVRCAGVEYKKGDIIQLFEKKSKKLRPVTMGQIAYFIQEGPPDASADLAGRVAILEFVGGNNFEQNPIEKSLAHHNLDMMTEEVLKKAQSDIDKITVKAVQIDCDPNVSAGCDLKVCLKFHNHAGKFVRWKDVPEKRKFGYELQITDSNGRTIINLDRENADKQLPEPTFTVPGKCIQTSGQYTLTFRPKIDTIKVEEKKIDVRAGTPKLKAAQVGLKAKLGRPIEDFSVYVCDHWDNKVLKEDLEKRFKWEVLIGSSTQRNVKTVCKDGEVIFSGFEIQSTRLPASRTITITIRSDWQLDDVKSSDCCECSVDLSHGDPESLKCRSSANDFVNGSCLPSLSASIVDKSQNICSSTLGRLLVLSSDLCKVANSAAETDGLVTELYGKEFETGKITLEDNVTVRSRLLKDPMEDQTQPVAGARRKPDGNVKKCGPQACCHSILGIFIPGDFVMILLGKSQVIARIESVEFPDFTVTTWNRVSTNTRDRRVERGKPRKGDGVRSRADPTRTGRVEDDDGTARLFRVRVRWDDTGAVSAWLGPRDVEATGKVKDIVERVFVLHTSVMPVGPQEQPCAEGKASSSKAKSVNGRYASRQKDTDPSYDDYLAKVLCQECGKDEDTENTMLMCDTCDCGYHPNCLNPRLKKVPSEDEEWTCVHCKMDFFAKNVFFCDDADFPKSLTTQMNVICSINIESSSSQTKWFDEIDDKSFLNRISCKINPSGRPKYVELIDLEDFVVLQSIQSSKWQDTKSSWSGPYVYGSVKKLGLRFRDETGAYCLPNAVDGLEVIISWPRSQRISLKGDCYHSDGYRATKIDWLPDFNVTKSTEITVQVKGTHICLQHLLKMKHGEPAVLRPKLENLGNASGGGSLGVQVALLPDSCVRVHEEFRLMIEVQDAHQEQINITDCHELEMTEFYFEDSFGCRNDVESRQENFKAGEQQWGPVSSSQAQSTDIMRDKGEFSIPRCRFQGKSGKGRLIMKAQLVFSDSTKASQRKKKLVLGFELSLNLVAGDAKMVTLMEPLITCDPNIIIPISREAPDLKRIKVQVTDVSQNLVHWTAGIQLNFIEPFRRACPFMVQKDAFILDLKIADFQPSALQKGTVIQAKITSAGSRGRLLEAQPLSFLVEASNRVEKISQELSNSEAVFSNETFEAKVTLSTEDNKSLPRLCRRACAIILWRVGQTAEEKRVPLHSKECRNVKWQEQGNTVSFEIPANLVNGNSTDVNNKVVGEYFLSFEYKEERDGFNEVSTMKSDPCKITVLPGPACSVRFSSKLTSLNPSVRRADVFSSQCLLLPEIRLELTDEVGNLTDKDANGHVVSVNIKPEIPDQYRQHFQMSDSSELILGGSAGPTVAFQGLKLVACDQNTPLNKEIVLHFCIQSDFQIRTTQKKTHLELWVNVYDDQARDAEEETLQNSKSQLKKQADICSNEITRLKENFSPLAKSLFRHQRDIAQMKHDVVLRDVDAKFQDACSKLTDVERESSQARQSYPQKQYVLCRVSLPRAGIKGLVGIAVGLFTIQYPDVKKFDAVQKALSSAFGPILNFALFEDEDAFQRYMSQSEHERKRIGIGKMMTIERFQSPNAQPGHQPPQQITGRPGYLGSAADFLRTSPQKGLGGLQQQDVERALEAFKYEKFNKLVMQVNSRFYQMVGLDQPARIIAADGSEDALAGLDTGRVSEFGITPWDESLIKANFDEEKQKNQESIASLETAKTQIKQFVQKKTDLKSIEKSISELDSRLSELSDERSGAPLKRTRTTDREEGNTRLGSAIKSPTKRRSDCEGPADDAFDRPRQRSRGDGGHG